MTTSGTDGPRFDSRRRVTTTFASDTRHLEAYQPPRDAQHDPSSEQCFCPTCHLRTAHFPRRHDGRIMLPPPVPSQKTRSASSASVSKPYTQSESLVGSDRRGVVDVPMIATAAGLGPRKARRSASPNPPHSHRSSSASRIHKDANHRQSSRPSGSQYAQPIRSHVSEPYPSEVLPKAQRYASGESSKLKGKARMASGASTSAFSRPPSAALDARWDHERQPFSHFLEPLPPLGTSIVHPKPVGPSRVSPEHIEPVLYPTLRTVDSSNILSPIPTGPLRASSSRDEALPTSFDAPPRPPSAPGDRPPSRFFRFRPELFDQYVEVPESCNVSIEATHMSYQEQCEADAQTSTALPIAGPSKLTAIQVVPEPSTSLEGARSSQILPYSSHSKGLDAASERMDDRIGAFSFEKTITPPMSQPASASATTTANGKAAAAPTTSRAKRNRSSDKYASGSNVQVKWDSERKRRQGYFAQDDGNEKSPFRHYNQTSCNFDP